MASKDVDTFWYFCQRRGPSAHEFGTAKFVLRGVASEKRERLGGAPSMWPPKSGTANFVFGGCSWHEGRSVHEIGTANFVFGGAPGMRKEACTEIGAAYFHVGKRGGRQLLACCQRRGGLA